MSLTHNRRSFLAMTGGAIIALQPRFGRAAPVTSQSGLVVGQPQGIEAGMEVLAAGGNAVDAAVAAALAAAVVAAPQCGIGGYGCSITIGLPNGRVTSIDGNSTAPAAARPDMFPVNEKGEVAGQKNKRGWLAAGVPGTLAGLQLAIDKYGSQSFAKLVKPAIRFAREGVAVDESFEYWYATVEKTLQRDPTSKRIFFRDGEALRQGDVCRNPDLAEMLEKLAERGSVESFYRGDIGQQIAQAFKENGGLVTAADMAAYRAREVQPIVFEWRGYTIATAPPTAGGLTMLQALAALKALDWNSLPSDGPTRAQARIEALRIAWNDRLRLFGDPAFVDIPAKRLLSEQYARQSAERIRLAIAEKRPVPAATDGRPANGTINIAAVDAKGMVVALTLTHGESFGAQVAVDGLGLVLGHGMSRFDPVPGRANSIAPGKRPLHNMTPTVILRNGRPVVALGGRGGRRIPNSIFEVVLNFVGNDRSLEESMRAPRLHTEGGMECAAEIGWPEADIDFLKGIGYVFQQSFPCFVSAVQFSAERDGTAQMLAMEDFLEKSGLATTARDVHLHQVNTK